MGFNEILASEAVGPVNDRQREVLRRGTRAGQRLLGLIENILTMSRVESPGHADLTVTLDLPEPGIARVMGDAAQLERALINVVTNALRFTPGDGEVRVGLHTENPGRVVVTVDDTRIGIPTEEQHRLFERFFRASSAVRASIPGPGLGLAIVRTIGEVHLGTVTVDSRPGEGTTVRITLPLLDAA
jgi:signal transduction histidine kinase